MCYGFDFWIWMIFLGLGILGVDLQIHNEHYFVKLSRSNSFDCLYPSVINLLHHLVFRCDVHLWRIIFIDEWRSYKYFGQKNRRARLLSSLLCFSCLLFSELFDSVFSLQRSIWVSLHFEDLWLFIFSGISHPHSVLQQRKL